MKQLIYLILICLIQQMQKIHTFGFFSPTKYFLFNVKVQLLKLIKIFLLLKRLYDPKQVPPLAILIVRS